MGNQIRRLTYRLAHRFGWHHTRTFWVDTDRHRRCDYCGLHEVTRFDPLKIEDWRPVMLKDIDFY